MMGISVGIFIATGMLICTTAIEDLTDSSTLQFLGIVLTGLAMIAIALTFIAWHYRAYSTPALDDRKE